MHDGVAGVPNPMYQGSIIAARIRRPPRSRSSAPRQVAASAQPDRWPGRITGKRETGEAQRLLKSQTTSAKSIRPLPVSLKKGDGVTSCGRRSTLRRLPEPRGHLPLRLRQDSAVEQPVCMLRLPGAVREPGSARRRAGSRGRPGEEEGRALSRRRLDPGPAAVSLDYPLQDIAEGASCSFVIRGAAEHHTVKGVRGLRPAHPSVRHRSHSR